MFKYASKRKNLWSFQIVPKLDNLKGMGVVLCRHGDETVLQRIVETFKDKSIIKETVEKFEDLEERKPFPIDQKHFELLDNGTFERVE